MSKKEQEMFEKTLRKTNIVLKAMGLQFKDADIDRNFISRVQNRWWVIFNMLWFFPDVAGEIMWAVFGVYKRVSFVQLTYTTPCITLSLLGIMKAYYFIKYHHHVLDIINTIKKLQVIDIDLGMTRQEIEDELIKEKYPYMNYTINLISASTLAAVGGFVISPLIIIASNYILKGEVKLLLPFLIKYPFNPEDIRIWPFVFLHQVWSAFVTTLTVHGPDTFLYCCCTFIHIQLRAIHYDLERIIPSGTLHNKFELNDTFRIKLTQLVNRHRELIRCVNLLELIFSKSTLFNVVTSSLLICFTGFNILALNDFFLIIPFLGFCSMSLLQIYFFCYYGDMLICTSTQLSDAVFNSAWYRASAAVVKQLIFILIRAKKPCKMTAFGFADISMRTFMRILSTAWSYFALLKTMYHE